VAVLFFDTSALIRRYDRSEPGAQDVRALCRRTSGHQLLIARITPVEVAAALNRKQREGRLDQLWRDRLWQLFRTHWRSQYRIVVADEQTWRGAERLPFVHTLRAYDAVQLASALQARAALGSLVADFRLCTADRQLARAAAQEGLVVELIQ